MPKNVSYRTHVLSKTPLSFCRTPDTVGNRIMYCNLYSQDENQAFSHENFPAGSLVVNRGAGTGGKLGHPPLLPQ